MNYLALTNTRCSMLRSLLIALIFATVAVVGIQHKAWASDNAACYVETATLSYPLYVGYDDWEGCAKVIQASGYSDNFRFGYWANYYMLAVNADGEVYFTDGSTEWQFAGVIHNSDGSTGSLWDRCSRGNTKACNQFSYNSQLAIDALNAMYPPGWMD